MTKPKIKPADQQVYARFAALERGTPLTYKGKPVKFHGMTGNLITLKPRSGKIIYLRAGDQDLKELVI